ncbi:Site-specific recombinase XerD [Desulfocicer vacuolatum DSM 3385]|uniref:Site-specific recombinase XerD n=1 Tax=Desulfocicer vacuolatum DSM 3385 TaxID=1121400 RepID=A0A1W2A448_9BACT|nr:site-specific integrase [Desulfocicer vacuolatum]SMC55416.1 Site-specific recombinase XerD [Desulfocicer vacuolatum DSM 3385]
MTITLHCPKCKSGAKIGSKECKKCSFKFTPNGRKYRVAVKLANGKRKSKVVNSLNLAKKLEAKLKTESVENGMFNIQKSPNLSDIWSQYLTWAKANKKSWTEDQGRWTHHVKSHLKAMTMDKITARDIEAVLEAMNSTNNRQKKPYAPQTVKHVLILMKRVFNWAIRRDLYHGQNPCLKVKPPKFDNRINKTLSKKDLEKLLSVLDSWENQRGAMVVKFALYTGKRRGEVLSLKWNDIDFENRLMTFHGSTTKNGKSQTLPINNKAYEILLTARELNKNDAVFSSRKGKAYSPNGFHSIWKRIRAKAGVNIRFHDLRHTYASYLASSGKVDIYTLKELLGHSDINMTQRYAHLINGALRKAACVADEVF